MTPREIVESIYQQKLSAGEPNLRTIAAAIDRLQKAFPRYGSFLMEFIQNADDAGSTTIKFDLQGRSITVSNDGEAFVEENVRSICDVGGSTKSPEEYIGYLGVGFKSVFIISNCTRIASGDFRFTFDRNRCANPKVFPWQIVPYWEDELAAEEGYTTTFTFDIKDPNLVDKIREEFRPGHLNDRILLFLRNVKSILIVDHENNYERKLQKSEVESPGQYTIFRITQQIGQTHPSSVDWLTFKEPYNVPPEVSNDSVTIDWERQWIKKREVVIAFRLTEDRKLLPEPKGTAHIGVFSFLPLKEIQSGLKFLIQADFLTAPGRGELARDCKWNEWLTTCAYRILVERCIPLLTTVEVWRLNYSAILVAEETGHELFKKYLTTPLESYLKNNLLLVAEDGSAINPEQAVDIQEPVRGLLDESDLQALFRGKKVIDEHCDHIYDERIDSISSDLKQFLGANIGDTLLKRKAAMSQTDWFESVYQLFVDTYDLRYFRNQGGHYNVNYRDFWNRSIRYLSAPIMLTDDLRLATISDCFLNPKKLTVPAALKDKPDILHSKIALSTSFLNFYRKLNESTTFQVPPNLTELELRNRIFKEEADALDEVKWAAYGNDERIEKLKALKHLFTSNLIRLEELRAKLSVRAKSGTWFPPDQVVFGKEYSPKHSFESVVAKGLYDQTIHFLDNVFLEQTGVNHVKEWRDFFSALGVDRRLEKGEDDIRDIVERVAVLSTLKYEDMQGRSPKEREASSRNLGWDVDSNGRKIEIKGTSNASGFDLLLSKNEQRAFFREDDFYIYVVTDTLSNPKLSVLNGRTLRESRETEGVRLLFEYKVWNETTNAKIEEHQF